ncbi:MAG: carbohydrate-binding domain-containing protein [Defluviitaleaceae bacterium]|nr:carbohydrate-binding domain-containing protein [Defluviitaleaceae bacterium]
MENVSKKTLSYVSAFMAFLMVFALCGAYVVFAVSTVHADPALTTITNTRSGNITVGNGQALLISGAGRVNGNITVMPGGTLTINANHTNTARAVNGRIFIQGGHVEMVNGRVGGQQNNATPTVVLNSGSFTMNGGTLHSNSGHNHGGFAVEVNDGVFTLNGGVVIGGNGLQSSNAPAVRVNAQGNFIMNGGTIRGDEILATTHGTRGVHVNGGTFTMYSGIIRSYINNNRPAVHVTAGAFEMHGGSVQTGNNANAIGVRVDGGIFTMYDGEIRNRSNGFNGTGVDVRLNGHFEMNGGDIHTNLRGVDVHGTHAVFNMDGGIIRNNRVVQGAGVRAQNGATFNLSGAGTITNNRAVGGTRSNRGGGGVMVSGLNTAFNMNGGVISNNIAEPHSLHTGEPRLNGFDGRGGGVLVTGNAIFNMNSGVIEGNTAPAGGGVAVLSYNNRETATAFNMHGGTIRSNRSVNVGGAYTLYYTGGGVQVIAFNRTANASGRGTIATFNMFGGYVEDNVATSYDRWSGEWGVNGGGVSVVTQTGLFTLYPVDQWPQVPANAIFNFHGGSIRGNEAVETNPDRVRTTQTGVPLHSNRRYVGAGGVFVHKNGAVMNMFDGAVIENNIARNGGGVTVSNTGTFNMYGGSIRNNIARGGYLNSQGFELRGGGGVYLHNSDYSYPHRLAEYRPGQSWHLTPGMTPTFNMLGGEIVNNQAPSGGGVYWNIMPVDWLTLPGIPALSGRNPIHTRPKFVNNLFNRETNLARVNIGPNAVIANNIAWGGTFIDDEVWVRHQVGNETMFRWQGVLSDGTPNEGVSPHMRSTSGVGANPFNNHDILTWGGFLGDGDGLLMVTAEVTVSWNTVSTANTAGENIARVTATTPNGDVYVIYVENGETIDVEVGAEIVVEPVITTIADGEAGHGEPAFRVMAFYVDGERTTLARLEDGELIEYPETSVITYTLTEENLEIKYIVEEQFWFIIWQGIYFPGMGWIIIGEAPNSPIGPFINGQDIPLLIVPFGAEYTFLIEIREGVFMIQTVDGLIQVEVVSEEDIIFEKDVDADVISEEEEDIEEEISEEEDDSEEVISEEDEEEEDVEDVEESVIAE